MFEEIVTAVGTIFPALLPWILLGVFIGIIFGAIPGLGVSLAVVIFLPFTFTLEPNQALILLIAIYTGGMYGGCIPAIVMNVPGTASAAATTFDGYPMAESGRALEALTISAVASSFGSILSSVLVLLLIPIAIPIVLLLGAPEYFLIAMIGIVMIAYVAQGSLLKGLTAGSLGLLLSTIGMAPLPTARYTFGYTELQSGVAFVVIILAVFAIAEMIRFAAQPGGVAKGQTISGSRLTAIKGIAKRPLLFTKSMVIGMIVGFVPGAGASVSNFFSYSEAVRSSKAPDKFGNGAPEGVIASEAGNSGTIAGSIIPTVAFGVPGSAATAILLGALIMHGLRPGPTLFTQDVEIVYLLYVSIIFGGIIIAIVGTMFIAQLYYVTKIDTNIIIPMVIVLSVLGAYTLNRSWVDVFTLAVVGYLAYYMRKHNYSAVAFLLGVILGPIAEDNLIRSLSLSQGSLDIFVSSIPSVLLVLLLIGLVAKPLASVISTQVRG